VNDIETLKLALAAVTAVMSVVLGVLAWALKRNLRAQDEQLRQIATDTRQLAGTVGKHSEQLASGVVRFQEIERRVGGLEERERGRLEEAASHRHRRHTDPVSG